MARLNSRAGPKAGRGSSKAAFRTQDGFEAKVLGGTNKLITLFWGEVKRTGRVCAKL